MKTTQHKITIELVPYDVEVTGQKTAIIKDSIGSILGKLNNNPEVTNFDSSNLKFAQIIEGLWVNVSVVDNDVVFEKVEGRKRLSFDRLYTWIADNFDRIDSIGCETLETKVI